MLHAQTLLICNITWKNKPANYKPTLKANAPTTTDTYGVDEKSLKQNCIASDDASTIELSARDVTGF